MQTTEEKARRDDKRGDVLRLLGEGGIRLMTQLISIIHVYQTGECPKDFTEVNSEWNEVDAKATKCSDSHTQSPSPHAQPRQQQGYTEEG
jgi:hypothetical protein